MISAIAARSSAVSTFGQLAVVLAGIAGAAVIAIVGLLAVSRPPAPADSRGSRAAAWGGPIAATRDGVARRTHPVVAAVLAVAAGLVAAFVVTYAFGVLSQTRVVVHLDRPIDHFVDGHRIALVSRLMLTATLLGSYPVVYTIAVTAGLIMGVLSRRWLPLLVLAAAVPTEIVLQKWMGTLIHGSKPSAQLAIGPPGGFFSGGSARTLIVCGLLAYFLGWVGLARRQRALVWTFAALATFIEGYSRLYLGRHWAVDIAGGWLLGGLVLAAVALAAGALRQVGRRPARTLSTVATTSAIAAIVIAAIVIAAIRGTRQPGGSPARVQAASAPAHTGSLVPSRGALFGAWVQPTGFGTAGEETAVVALEHELGRKLAIDQLYVRWAAPMPLAVAGWDLRQGRLPMISWAGARTDLIASGAYDTQIRARASQLRALRGPVMLRWFAEMDGTVNRATARSPASFIAAWHHIHDIFTSVGATNVRWVWCPNAFNFRTGIARRFYPGNAFVDWIGADGYNWAPARPHARWASFGQIFLPFYRWGVSAGKPLLVGEYGVLERAPGEKAAWFSQADHELRTRFPAIRAVVYFDSHHEHFNWRVTTSQSAFAAFRAFARDPYFNARPAISYGMPGD